jgi:hypothetical protein
MTKKIMKPSKLIMENARDIYVRKTGKQLLSYQTPTTDCVIQSILDFIDDTNPDIEIAMPDLPTIQLEDENDHQPQYRKQ